MPGRPPKNKIITPDKNSEAMVPSGLALAFHFITGELSTLSRSKIAAAVAKSRKIGVLPGGSRFLKSSIRLSDLDRPQGLWSRLRPSSQYTQCTSKVP